MPRARSTSLTIFTVLSLGLGVPVVGSGQNPVADPADVGTLAGMVHAWYDVINGPPGAPRQWRRDSTLYTTGATFIAVAVKDGKPQAVQYTPEQFRQAVNDEFVTKGFYETEVGSRVERFGNLAQVRSVYESRRSAGGPIIARGVNYILLYWDGTRWWISGAIWEDENATFKLPAAWVGSHEAAP